MHITAEMERKYNLPVGITYIDGIGFEVVCPVCRESQEDKGDDAECDNCDHKPMPTLSGTDWPRCANCDEPLSPEEITQGLTLCPICRR